MSCYRCWSNRISESDLPVFYALERPAVILWRQQAFFCNLSQSADSFLCGFALASGLWYTIKSTMLTGSRFARPAGSILQEGGLGMSEKKAEKFPTYKGKPLVRCGDTIYYGSMKDKYVIKMDIKSKTPLCATASKSSAPASRRACIWLWILLRPGCPGPWQRITITDRQKIMALQADAWSAIFYWGVEPASAEKGM